MTDAREKIINAFLKLLDTIDTLHGPQGCPWDKEQSHKSLRPYVIEEAYEVVHAIDLNNSKYLQEELGDLLLQILFHSKIASQAQKFEINDVMEGIANKLIRRHPHVFADTKVKDSAEVRQNWEKIKADEKKEQKNTSLLSDIPLSLPALLKAYKIGKKVSQVGFDWPEVKGVFQKIKEEIQELEEAIETKNKEAMNEEMGDLLFSIANLARFMKINPEEALRQTNEKFASRFQFVENKIQTQNKSFQDFDLEKLDLFWNEAKENEKRKN